MQTDNLQNTDLNESKTVLQLREKSSELSQIHLRELLSNPERNRILSILTDSLLFDYSHEKLDSEAVSLLLKLAEEKELLKKFNAMFKGDKINSTEKRRVLHRALRMSRDESLTIDGQDIVKDVHAVLDRVKQFSSDVREGKRTGHTGKKLSTFISIGIGGSYLAGDFVYNSLKSHQTYEKLSEGLELKFLANVCPIDFSRAVKAIDFEQTLFIVISKTFTTAETMLNARNCKQWLLDRYREKYPNLSDKDIESIISKQFVAVSTNIAETDRFGIDKENVFGFWDWVGGRYSVWSAVGALPLSLAFGFEVFQEFLSGGRSIDETIVNCKSTNGIKENIPIMMGLIGFWNTFICGKSTRVILPYSQALCKFPNHVQQLDMESNGKSVSITSNKFVDYQCGPVVFGEPGTNGQHSFYQLIHQGRSLSCEFIGHAKPQFDLKYNNEIVSNHDELMSNFFAQPDALANGKYTEEELQGIPPELAQHKTFKGNNTSFSILLKELNAFTTGQLLAIYEHRVATEGFIYDINSFDQWGVELGKVLANDVRKVLAKNVLGDEETKKFNSATLNLMNFFTENKK